jgi:hypothetical protein
MEIQSTSSLGSERNANSDPDYRSPFNFDSIVLFHIWRNVIVLVSSDVI